MNINLEVVIDNIREAVEKACIDSCNEIANGIKDMAQQRATLDPNEVAYSIYAGYDNIGEFATYQSNFKVKEATQVGNEVKSRAYNDYQVYFKRLGENVPYGNFIEWGTGTSGSGAIPPMDYTLEPWDERTSQQSKELNTFGMVACPHWTPAFHKYDAKKKEIFDNNLRKYL